MTVSWKASAQEEVRDIYSYLFDRSPKAAENWADELAKKLGYITQFPQMGRTVPDFFVSINDIREVFVGRYRLIYSIQESVPKVLAVRPMGRPLGKI